MRTYFFDAKVSMCEFFSQYHNKPYNYLRQVMKRKKQRFYIDGVLLMSRIFSDMFDVPWRNT